MFFIKEYKAKNIKEPDILKNRKRVLSSKNLNLLYLLNKRFSWMKKFIKEKKLLLSWGQVTAALKE